MAAAGQEFDPSEYYKRLVRAIVGITQPIVERRIEEFSKQTIWVERTHVLRFQHARTLKFREAFQLITGQAAQEINYIMTISRGGSAKKSTYQGRARGDNGQWLSSSRALDNDPVFIMLERTSGKQEGNSSNRHAKAELEWPMRPIR